ncbi:hypothetical protein [Kordiimonas sp. SCSIO 12610]|uniref:hypothetical protein n=1 Tax=Kordiimonas sp. SCSIO 12610 TaxID=2829597 RepID=UPI00210C35BB|nr:hypothetical protein [Kordiimonas sp. SCSIO 12610]UTW56149.1 hypothetical protein KFF44_04435 [Kordiimonas sp. SCSIO 12610]
MAHFGANCAARVRLLRADGGITVAKSSKPSSGDCDDREAHQKVGLQGFKRWVLFMAPRLFACGNDVCKYYGKRKYWSILKITKIENNILAKR